MKHKLFVETILEGDADYIIRSNVRFATNKEIREARQVYKTTKKCKHNIVYDVSGWMYDERACGICGRGLGLI